MKSNLDIFKNSNSPDKRFIAKFNEGIYIIHPLKYIKICFPNTASKSTNDTIIFYFSFNMNRDIIKSNIKLPFITFKDKENNIDDYSIFQILYDKNDNFKAIKIFDFDFVIIDGDVIYKNDYIYDNGKGDVCNIEKSTAILLTNGKVENIIAGVEGFYN